MKKTVIKIKELKFYLWVGAAWLMFWLFNASLSHSSIFIIQSLNESWQVLYLVAVNMVFFEYSLPLILKKRSPLLKYVLVAMLLLGLHLVLISLGLYGWKYLGVQLHIYTSLRDVTLLPNDLYNKIIEESIYLAQYGIASTFFFGMAKLLYANFKLKQTEQQLRLEKQEAELNYLKSQTNPHFLFNTLNNIYSLSKDKSDLAPESILRLSKILRFMLYETGGAFITVEQELEVISDYIGLEKIRYDDSLLINFKHEIDDMKQPLPPLFLVPLVENAFKHGVSETSNKPFVDINLTIKNNELIYCVKNSSENTPEGKDVRENIGLANLRRQLELLYTDYDLTAQQTGDKFIATLKINLASHV